MTFHISESQSGGAACRRPQDRPGEFWIPALFSCDYFFATRPLFGQYLTINTSSKQKVSLQQASVSCKSELDILIRCNLMFFFYYYDCDVNCTVCNCPCHCSPQTLGKPRQPPKPEDYPPISAGTGKRHAAKVWEVSEVTGRQRKLVVPPADPRKKVRQFQWLLWERVG